MSTTAAGPGARMVFDDAALARVLGQVQSAAVRTALTEMDVYLVTVADSAAAQWYQQVDKDTGLSGDIEGGVVAVTDTLIRGVIGSTDTRRGKNGKPVIFYIHRPGPLSTKARRATHEDFRTGRAKASKRGERVSGRGVVLEHNPKASDGAYLVPELITKPANAGKRALKAAIEAEIPRTYRR